MEKRIRRERKNGAKEILLKREEGIYV